jgi:hypothetical protein
VERLAVDNSADTIILCSSSAGRLIISFNSGQLLRPYMSADLIHVYVRSSYMSAIFSLLLALYVRYYFSKHRPYMSAGLICPQSILENRMTAALSPHTFDILCRLNVLGRIKLTAFSYILCSTSHQGIYTVLIQDHNYLWREHTFSGWHLWIPLCKVCRSTQLHRFKDGSE